MCQVHKKAFLSNDDWWRVSKIIIHLQRFMIKTLWRLLRNSFPSASSIYNLQSITIFQLFLQGRCNREKPPCKYFHPPQHLKDQLLINGRNHLALKNALMQQMGMAPNGQPIITSQLQPMVSVTFATAAAMCIIRYSKHSMTPEKTRLHMNSIECKCWVECCIKYHPILHLICAAFPQKKTTIHKIKLILLLSSSVAFTNNLYPFQQFFKPLFLFFRSLDYLRKVHQKQNLFFLP